MNDRIIALLTRSPWLTAETIAIRVGASGGGAREALRRLHRAGLVEWRSDTTHGIVHHTSKSSKRRLWGIAKPKDSQ